MGQRLLKGLHALPKSGLVRRATLLASGDYSTGRFWRDRPRSHMVQIMHVIPEIREGANAGRSFSGVAGAVRGRFAFSLFVRSKVSPALRATMVVADRGCGYFTGAEGRQVEVDGAVAGRIVCALSTHQCLRL